MARVRDKPRMTQRVSYEGYTSARHGAGALDS